ncbi:Squalene epoxidase [Entophlyctis luteolus]|nr:Squalene epoxidase [Entophlyctis luteolus]
MFSPEECLKGIDAIECKGYNVIQQDTSVLLPYSYENGKSGCGFHHGQFIMKLREAAKACNNVSTMEGTVSALLTEDDNDRVIGVYAPLTVVCDGCFSKFRKEVNNKPVKVSSTFVGLILKDCKLPNPNHGHVVLAQPSPVLLYQIGTHDTRALVDIPGAKIPSVSSGALATYMREKVCPQLPESVRPSFLAAVETNDMRSMPNSHLVPAQNTRRGVVLLGDANNMRHPLTGGGMTVAFWDVVHLRDVLRGADLDEFDDVRRRVKQVHWKRKEISATVNILANALYALFAAGSDPYAKVLQDGCVGYFKLGGICVSTPIGLLSGMLTNPLALIVHFFAVAIYGMLLLFASRPVYELPLTVVRAVGAMVVACFIVLPLIMNELQP